MNFSILQQFCNFTLQTSRKPDATDLDQKKLNKLKVLQLKSTVAYLLLHVFIGKEEQFLSKDCLLTQDVLVIHFLHQVRIVDSICLEKLHIGHLECLTY